MITSYLQNIVKIELQKGSDGLYIRSLLKEYLQIILLEFIYTNEKYKSNLVFTGETCLRHFHNLERLSEDLDFDFINPINVEDFKKDIEQHFTKILKYPDVQISIKQKGRQVLLKFPVLRELGLASESESNLLYIKSDLSQAIGVNYKTEKSAKSLFGYNFVALLYDLPTLFAGKIVAVLSRNLKKGKENRQVIKGRDFYDLLWFLKQGVSINLKLVEERTGKKFSSIEELQDLLDEKVKIACTVNKTDFKNDLMPFINSPVFIKDYVDNYFEEYGSFIKLMKFEREEYLSGDTFTHKQVFEDL